MDLHAGKHAGKIVVNGAPSQHDRWLAALDPGYVDVDGRSFVELLDFPLRFGRLIHFYDLTNEIDGDWVVFFAQDPTMILAAIMALDATRLEANFLSLERETIAARSERKFDLLRQLFAAVMALARDINGWLEALGPNPQGATAKLLYQQIVAAIDRDLAAELARLVGYAEGAALPDALGRRIPLDLTGLLPIWHLRGVCADGAIYRGRSKSRKIDHACPYITAVFQAFLDAIARLQVFARTHFTASLEEADHAPQIALYIAFARLFRTAQDTLNTISGRYVHFYYHDVLREDFRAAVPDQVYLAFALATDQDITSTTVARGTLFSAGPDSNGIEILYAADKSLAVTAASIVKLRTLRVASDFLLGPAAETGRRIFSSEIAVATPGGSDAWNTFGETEIGNTPTEVTTLATLGFAIASPYLLLSGGIRTVTVQLSYSPASEQQLALRLAAIAEAAKLDCGTVWRDVLGAAFTLYVSTANGWLEIESYDVLADPSLAGDPSFGLEFSLPPTADPVAPFPAPPAEGATASANPDPTQPTLKACLNQQPVTLGVSPHTLEVYPLSLLALIELTDWAIDTNVSQLSQLQLANTDGEVDPSTPFLLLGAPPVLGSFFQIGHPELFAKTLAALSITINWFNLPQNQDGFKGWYRDYVIGLDGKHQDNLFDNQTFGVGICVVNPQSWDIAAKAVSPQPSSCTDPHYCLFRTKSPKDGPPDCTETYADLTLCPSTVFDELPVIPTSPPSYANAADSAIRIQLDAPSYAFGDDLYALNVLSAVIGDLPDPVGGPNAGPARCQEWKILWDAGQWIGACMAACAMVPAATYQSCITPNLEACMLQILQAAIDCLLDCLVDSPTPPGDAKTDELRRALRVTDDASVAARARTLRQQIDRLRGTTDPPAPLYACLARCGLLLDAILGILVCEAEAALNPDTYKESITACLTVVIQQLQQPYEDCCKEIKYPNSPWLPLATSVAVDYAARCSAGGGAASGRFYYLLPFDGYTAPAFGPTISLLPTFAPGSLYVGFSGLVAPQSLTLLFQMAAASSAGWLEQPPAVTWSYLACQGWTALTPAQILADGTNGLQNSGILALDLPAFDPVSTMLDPDCQWLGASTQWPALFPKTSCIAPHALLATWQDNGSLAHLGQPLPAGTITSSVESLPAIATIAQPMESFGGRAPETGRSFQTFLGERLRHKDRGVLGWDYERLVLEQFPSVWKVQALAARGPLGATPGSVLVVVVPGPNSIEVMDPTAPVASADLLGRIGASLATSISPFVTLEVANPRYVRITVQASVLFADDEDPGAAIRRLNDELVQYLSPWPYDAARAAKGGDYASEDEISEFIQTRPYVDALLTLVPTYDPDPALLDWYFLTSAKQHDITAAATTPRHQPRGINFAAGTNA